jgi:hypothetical protein
MNSDRSTISRFIHSNIKIITTSKYQRDKIRLGFVMNQENMPARQQIEKTLFKSRRERQKLELASLELEDIIVQLEEASRLKRAEQLSNI